MVQLIFRVLTLNLLSLSRIHYQFTIFSANSLCINKFFANLLWIHFFFREFTMVPFIFRVLTLNLLFLSRIHSQSIIFFANQLSIHLFFLVITLNSLSLSRVHYGSIMFFANSLHYLYRDRSIIFFANSLLIYYLFARSLWILYLLREFTINFFTLLDEIITWYMVCIGQYMLFPGKASLFLNTSW